MSNAMRVARKGESMSKNTSSEATNRPQEQTSGRRVVSTFPWKRFLIQSLIAMAVFNVIAGLVTWYFIFPRLFPAAG
jgi:hypothetical protein